MVVFSWSDFMVQFPWSDSLKNNEFTRSLGFSLGVNPMWIKGNDHASKSMRVLIFYNHMLKKGSFEKKKKE